MITKSFLIFLACSIGLLVVQKTLAVRVAPNIEEFMEHHRSRSRPHYLVPRALDEELSAIDNLATIPEGMDAESSPGELSSEILGCANMIRNDMIYSDDSIRTTIRKRGNIRKKNVAKTVPTCACCHSKMYFEPLGEDYFPTKLESRKCVDTCVAPIRCKGIPYLVNVLKLAPRDARDEDFWKWEPQNITVTTSCECKIDDN